MNEPCRTIRNPADRVFDPHRVDTEREGEDLVSTASNVNP
jgi:hypothetical protein